MRATFMLVAPFLLWIGSSSNAQLVIEDAEPDMQLFGMYLSGPDDGEQFQTQVEREFKLIDTGDGVITVDDLWRHKAMSDARMRAHMATTLMFMDVNGDGFVTEEEVRANWQYEERSEPRLEGRFQSRYKVIWEEYLPFDGNGDNRIAWHEAAAGDLSKFMGRYFEDKGLKTLVHKFSLAMTFDADHDGELTFEEFKEPAAALFGETDFDHDGTLSREEACAFVRAIPFLGDESCN